MKIVATREFLADRPWGSALLADFGDVAARVHSTDQRYRWHRNTGPELFLVVDGLVDMHVRRDGAEQVIRLSAGDAAAFDEGDEHVAHPVGLARILVVERKDSE